MPSQEDYANLVYALSTMAKAPVAAYPESGAFLLAEQAQDVARAKLADEARKKAQKKAKKKGVVNSLVQTGATAIGAGTGFLAGGPAGAVTGAQLGASFGSGITGGGVDPSQIAGAFEKNVDAAEGGAAVYAGRRDEEMRRKKLAALPYDPFEY